MCRSLICGLLLFVAISPAAAEDGDARPAPPTRAEVERALAAGKADVRRLAEWGDAAVPVLLQVANDLDTTLSSRSTGQIPEVLQRIGTEAAASAFVQILRGRTGIGPHWALSQILHFRSPKPFLDHLRESEDLKGHAVRMLKGLFLPEDWIQVIVLLEWKDLVPQLRVVFKDGDFRAREVAADAILNLTGTRPVVDRPASVFPKANLSADLLGPPRSIPGSWLGAADHVTHVRWFDGTWRLVEMWRRRAVLRTSADVTRTGQPFAMPAIPRHVATASVDGVTRLLAFVGHSKEWSTPDRFLVLDAAGETLGSTDAGDEYWEPRGVLLASEEGSYAWATTAGTARNEILVFGFDGRVRSRAAAPILGSLRVHPSLPGWLLVTATRSLLHRHTPEGVEEGTEIDADVYASSGVLLPDAAGRPACVLGGSAPDGREGSAPDASDPPPGLLVRRDGDGTIAWRATLSGDVDEMVLLEPDGRPRLIVVTTEDGWMHLVEEDGTHRAQVPLPNPRKEHTMHAYSLSAGRVGDAWTIAVRLLWGTYVYVLSPGAAAQPSATPAADEAR